MIRNENEIAELKNFIARTHFYQKIDFGDGIITNGAFDSKEELETLRFDDVDFKNKTVLDIGCNAGFFSCEAKRRGAVVVDGIDRNIEQVNKAQHVALFLRQECRFGKGDIEHEGQCGWFGQYDIVFFFSVLHHLKFPLIAMQNIARLTKNLLIAEIKTKPKGDPRHTEWISEPAQPRDRFPDIETVTAMLEGYGFKTIHVFPGSKTVERIVFHAYKEDQYKDIGVEHTQQLIKKELLLDA